VYCEEEEKSKLLINNFDSIKNFIDVKKQYYFNRIYDCLLFRKNTL